MADRARCTVLLGSVFCTLVAVTAAADLTVSQEQAMLDGHNEIRSEVARGHVDDQPTAADMVKLDWDDDLAQVAQSWVDRCVWNHNPNRTSEYAALVGGNTYVGENLAVYGTTGSPPNLVDFALDAWFDEVANYTYGPLSSASASAIGHYTQLVWAGTHRVGCGLAVCPGSAFGFPSSFTGYYIACDYARGGNYIGSYPYEAGPTASHCPPGYPAAENGLCVMPEPGELAMLGSGALLLMGLRRRVRASSRPRPTTLPTAAIARPARSWHAPTGERDAQRIGPRAPAGTVRVVERNPLISLDSHSVSVDRRPRDGPLLRNPAGARAAD